MSAYRVYESDELGRDGYPPVWHESVKHEVREEAGDRCVRCGHPYERGAGEWSRCDGRCEHGGDIRWRWRGSEWALGRYTLITVADALRIDAERKSPSLEIEARYRILTVHHLDGAKGNLRWWNLVALCQRCHLQIQGKVLMARVWPWEHSEWFRPYVAGYYAATYLGEDLDRPEVEERLDELLALERAA